MSCRSSYPGQCKLVLSWCCNNVWEGILWLAPKVLPEMVVESENIKISTTKLHNNLTPSDVSIHFLFIYFVIECAWVYRKRI